MATTLSTRLMRTFLVKASGYMIILGFMIFTSCEKDFSNKAVYTIKVGETFKFYFKNNSCCDYCWNTENLSSIIQQGEIMEEDSDGDCAGCSTYYSMSFKGLKEGTDTVIYQQYSMSKGCDLSASNVSKFVVHVTK